MTRVKLLATLMGSFSLLTLQAMAPQAGSGHPPLAGMDTRWLEVAPAAASKVRYVPPKGRGTPLRTQGGGSRGCSASDVVLLMPTDHVGLTAVAHPTISWYHSQGPALPMQLVLVSAGMAQPLWSQEITPQNPGFNQFQLPPTAPELKPGQRYRLILKQVCPKERDTTYFRGWIERVALPSTFSAATQSKLPDRVSQLAGSGLWYDAIAAAVAEYQTQSPHGAEALKDLLIQGGLTQIASQARLK